MKDYIEVKTLDDKYVGVRTNPTVRSFNKTIKAAGLTAEQVKVNFIHDQGKTPWGGIIGQVDFMTGLEFVERFKK
jgi:hypothetical protein